MSSIAPDEGVTVGRRDHILAAATLAQKKVSASRTERQSESADIRTQLRARDLVGERCFYKFHATSVLWFAGTIGSCRVQGTKVEVRIRTAIYDKQTPYKTLHPVSQWPQRGEALLILATSACFARSAGECRATSVGN